MLLFVLFVATHSLERIYPSELDGLPPLLLEPYVDRTRLHMVEYKTPHDVAFKLPSDACIPLQVSQGYENSKEVTQFPREKWLLTQHMLKIHASHGCAPQIDGPMDPMRNCNGDNGLFECVFVLNKEHYDPKDGAIELCLPNKSCSFVLHNYRRSIILTEAIVAHNIQLAVNWFDVGSSSRSGDSDSR